MAPQNTLHVRMACPGCAVVSDHHVQFRFGHVWALDYVIGSTLRWADLRFDVGVRSDGLVAVDGYLFGCASCDHEDRCAVFVMNDVIAGVGPPSWLPAELPWYSRMAFAPRSGDTVTIDAHEVHGRAPARGARRPTDEERAMAVHNILQVRTACPACAVVSEAEVQFEYAHVWQLRYAIGSTLRWENDESDVGVRSGGLVAVDAYRRPCASCAEEGRCVVFVMDDVIAGVGPLSWLPAELPERSRMAFGPYSAADITIDADEVHGRAPHEVAGND